MHGHLSRELWRSVSLGWRDPGDLAALALAHLFESCPHCRREFEGWREEQRGESATNATADYEVVLDRVHSLVSTDGKTTADPQRREARSRAEQLLRLPPEQRVEWLRSEASKHAGPLLADALIEQARRRTPGHPYDGAALANLARLVLHHAPLSLEASTLYARALAYLANALRVIGDFPRADQILGDARYMLGSQGGESRLVRAELESLEGSLRIDQDRASEAVPLLLRCLMVYRLEGASSAATATLIKLANAHWKLRDSDCSLSLLKEGEAELEPAVEPGLRLICQENTAVFLVGGGAAEQAADVLARTRSLAEDLGNPLELLRRSWKEAWVCFALGDSDTAERLLAEARDGFSSRGIRFDESLVALDLAGLYLHQGRRSEALQLLKLAAPTFHELGLSAKVRTAQALRARTNSGKVDRTVLSGRQRPSWVST